MKPFEQLYEEQYLRVYKWFLNHMSGWAEPAKAEDFTQDTFLKAMQAYPRFETRHDTDGSLFEVEGWLFRIARNVLYDSYRRLHLDKELRNPGTALSIDELPIDAHPVDIDHSVEGTHARLDIVHAAESLTDNQFEIMRLRVTEDLSLAEVAEATGQDVERVKKTIARARNAIRRQIDTDYTTVGRYGGRTVRPPMPVKQAA